MQLRPELRIRTAIEAMTHVVIPALQENDQLAHEQAQLVVGMLATTLEWLPVEYAFDRAELSELIDTAAEIGAKSAVTGLEGAVERAEDILARAGADPRELVDGVRELRAALASTVDRTFEHGSAEDRKVVSRAILAAAARETPLLRSAYLGHGFEGTDSELPPLAELLSHPKRTTK
ncbi:hypothetical protein F8M49_20340 [Rhodococcus zopfii]|uniref:Uncharacterized protein n=1 Tax=Rhodococcus zopfii TaxID=43772 RepID=A0ABU3WSX3_9NOCA|nr:hypothetical protein [Rhodococcus zopfii]